LNGEVHALTSTYYRGTKVTAILGDITKQDTDAIVNPANSKLIMGGGVAGAIKRAGGPEIEREAIIKAPIPIGEAVETAAGRLSAKYVIHSPTMTSPAMQTSLTAVRKATMAALRLASKLHLGTLAMPGMGTGVGGVSPSAAADVMIREIKRFIDEGTELSEIRLACVDRNLLEAFDRAISTLLAR